MSSFLSVPVDSPHGDVRTSYTADAEVFSVTGLYNFDSYAFYNNYVDILADGEKGIEAPKANAAISRMKAAGYGDAVIIIPWQIYQQTGDTSLIEKYFGEMDSYMDTVSEQGYQTQKDAKCHCRTAEIKRPSGIENSHFYLNNKISFAIRR